MQSRNSRSRNGKLISRVRLNKVIDDIVRARPDEAETLIGATVAAKQYWGYSPDWMAAWASLLDITPAYIGRNEVYKAVIHDEMAGWYGLAGAPSICRLDHLWVLPTYIGWGIGRALFTHAVQRTRSYGAKRMEWEADPHAVGFYEKMGGRQIRETVSLLEGVLPILALEIEKER